MTKQLSIFDLQESQKNRSSKDCYLHIEGNIPIDLPNCALISLKRKPPLKIYSLGFQPAKSIPEITRWFLQKYGNLPFTILEPFAGSGTTILESVIYGASVYWLDYNPLSRLICQVKTSKFNYSEVIQEIEKVLNNSQHQKYAPETIYFKNKDFWFQKPVQEALEILRENIIQAKSEIKPLLWLVFSLTVRKTSDMNDGMILAAKRSHVKDIPKRDREDVFKYFKIYSNKAIEAIQEWQEFERQSQVITQELAAKSAIKIKDNCSIDAVITSPPYINAIDYIWATKFELHWLAMVKNDKERLDLYSQEIGTERIAKQQWKELGKTGNKKLDRLIEDIYTGKKYRASSGQNQLRSRVVYKYFTDMKNHFNSCFGLLKPGGYYCFAIGDVSKICGVDIPVASLLTEIASEVGFYPVFHFHLLLKNRRLNLPRNVNWAGTIKHDTVVVLQKGN